MLRIGEFSKLAKTTIKALRYYDKVGLLKPAFVDSSTSYRYYTDEQLETMRLILAYKAAGMQMTTSPRYSAEKTLPTRCAQDANSSCAQSRKPEDR